MKNLLRINIVVLILTLTFLVTGSGNAQNCNVDLPSDYSYQQSACLPKSIQYSTSLLNVKSYQWSFGDGQISTNANPVVTYPRFDVFTVKLTVTYVNGCIETVIKTVPVASEPDNLIVTNDTSICRGDSVLITTKANGFDSCWEASNSLRINSFNNAVAKPAVPTSYIFNSRKLGDNLVINGDFTGGNTSFTSAYLYNKNSGLYEGFYTVSNNPRLWHPAFSACGDHTTGSGNMIVVNGATEPSWKIWSQSMPVTPNSNYVFSTWLATVAESYPPNPASLQFSINGQLLGNLFNADLKSCIWQQFYSTWNSGNNTTATIQVVNMDTIAGGNDFALDDIFFGKITMKTDTIKVNFKTAKVNNIAIGICPGQTYKLPSGKVVQNEGSYVDTLTFSKCDTLITKLQLSINKPTSASKTAEICEGNSYYLPSGRPVKLTGIYQDTMRYSNGCDSLITQVNLNVKLLITRSASVTICSGQSYTFLSSKIIRTTGIYKDTLRYKSACDSLIMNYNITVQPVYTSDLSPVICEGQSYKMPAGSVVTTSGNYKDTVKYRTGCDSLVTTVNLTIQKVYRMDTSVTRCAGEAYFLPSGKATRAKGIYKDTVRYISGCDSLITMATLTVKAVSAQSLSAIICSGQTYTMLSGKVVKTSGVYKDTLRYAIGCDSLITNYTIAVLPVYTANLSPIICEGQSYKMPRGSVITSAGVYKDTIRYTSGCDSLITTVDITIQKVYRKDSTVSICSGKIYTLPSGKIATATGIYKDTLRYKTECDSLITTVNLMVKQVYVTTLSIEICIGTSYILPSGRAVSTKGIYMDTVRYISGCDSLISTTNLTINAPSYISKKVIVCYGNSYTLPSGFSVSRAGVYYDTVKYTLGCDSLITVVTISVETPVISRYSVRLCSGQSYKLPSGRDAFTTGVYNDTLRSQSGCDSLITIVDLNVTIPEIVTEAIQLCEGQTYNLPWGSMVELPGIYRNIIKSIAGCDSVITTIIISVNPKPVVRVTKSNDIYCYNAFATLSVSNVGKYKWVPASTLDNPQMQKPRASPTVSTVYKAQVISKDGCIGEDSIEVKVIRGNTDGSFFLPNAFTPDNDGNNDNFGIKEWSAVTDLKFSIYNRWGILIFQTTNPTKCWDGSYKGVPQNTGVFVYQLSANTPCGPVARKGTVMLIR